MNQQTSVPENEAIRQIIAEGGPMDYVDVVNAVKQRFQVDTTAAKVEQIHQEMLRARRSANQVSPAKVQLELTSKLSPEVTSLAASQATADEPDTDIAQALKFVDAVGGLSRAREALHRLEKLLQS